MEETKRKDLFTVEFPYTMEQSAEISEMTVRILESGGMLFVWVRDGWRKNDATYEIVNGVINRKELDGNFDIMSIAGKYLNDLVVKFFNRCGEVVETKTYVKPEISFIDDFFYTYDIEESLSEHVLLVKPESII